MLPNRLVERTVTVIGAVTILLQEIILQQLGNLQELTLIHIQLRQERQIM